MTVTVLIDGPSGAGKTTAALRLGRTLGWRVIHMDDVYPGWYGLADAAATAARDILAVRAGAGYFRWDWECNCRAEWVDVNPRENLILEGVGALTAASASAARRRGGLVTWALWGPVELRKARALERDPDYAPWWDAWAVQERQHFAGWARDGVVPIFQTVISADGDFATRRAPVIL